MPDTSEALLNVALEIKELLLLLAEPAVAQRDEKRRVSLRTLTGKSQIKQQAVLLMDGNKSQTEISQVVKIDRSDLSKLVKAMRIDGLLTANEKPQLTISLPTNFFEAGVDK